MSSTAPIVTGQEITISEDDRNTGNKDNNGQLFQVINRVIKK